MTIRPQAELVFQKPPKKKGIIVYRGLQFNVQPSLVFEYDEQGSSTTGATWLKPKIGGLEQSELGMLVELAFLWLQREYEGRRAVDSAQVYAVDMMTGAWVNYAMVERGEVLSALSKTADLILQIRNDLPGGSPSV